MEERQQQAEEQQQTPEAQASEWLTSEAEEDTSSAEWGQQAQRVIGSWVLENRI